MNEKEEEVTNNMNVLFLDDDPNRIRNFRSVVPYATIVETAPDCIEQLNNDWDVVFLDHDLGGEIFVDPKRKDTGSEVVRWIEANKPNIQRIIVHTCNHQVSYKMICDLTAAGYKAEDIPFPDLIENLDQILGQRKVQKL